MSTSHKVKLEKNLSRVLSDLPDFKNEETALQAPIESRGHIVIMSPKCHPEVAGVGIEYSWQMSKMKYRTEINAEYPKNLDENTVNSMCRKEILTLGRVRRFSRRSTRDMCRSYRALEKDARVSGAAIDGKGKVEAMR